jgi:hypothetical protein
MNIFTKHLPPELQEKECVFQCDDPRGSIITSIIIMAAGFIFIPLIVDIINSAISFTGDTVLQSIYTSVASIINYSPSFSARNYVIYFMISIIAGMLATRPVNALIAPMVTIAISLVAFFFISFFLSGYPVDYGVLIFGLSGIWFPLVVVMLFPSFLGVLVARVMYAKKSCYVLGKGMAVKK